MPNEFSSGWKPLLGALLGAGCGLTSIVFYTHGVFAVPIAEATGWQRSQIQFAFTLMSLMAIVTAPTVGFLVDRYGARSVGLYGIAGFAATFACLSFGADSIGLYQMLFVVLAVGGAGTLPTTWTAVINLWFHKNRALALGIALTGTGIAATIAPAYAGWLIGRFGWEQAYLWLAASVLVVALPSVFFLFKEPRADSLANSRADSNIKAQPSGREAVSRLPGVEFSEALRSYRLWILCASIALVAGSVSGLITSYVAHLTDAGVTFDEAVGFASVMGACIISGRLLAGFLADRIWAPAVAAALLLCPTGAALALDLLPISAGVALASAALIGVAAGAEVDLLAYLTSRYFGLKRYGSIYGLGFVCFSVSAGLAPAAFGLIYDVQGSYTVALRAAAIACAIGAVLLLALGPYPVFLDRDVS